MPNNDFYFSWSQVHSVYRPRRGVTPIDHSVSHINVNPCSFSNFSDYRLKGRVWFLQRFDSGTFDIVIVNEVEAWVALTAMRTCVAETLVSIKSISQSFSKITEAMLFSNDNGPFLDTRQVPFECDMLVLRIFKTNFRRVWGILNKDCRMCC